MAGIRLQIRQVYDSDALVYPLFLGELVHDTAKARLVVNNGENNNLPYPTLDKVTNRMLLAPGYSLVGPSGRIGLSFDTPNKLQVKDRSTGTVLADFGAVQTAKMAPDAMHNRGGPQSLEVFDTAYHVGSRHTLPYSAATYTLWKERGNTYPVVSGARLPFNRTIALNDFKNEDQFYGIRNQNSRLFNTLYARGGYGVVRNGTDLHLSNVSLRSYVLYPGAERMKLTFFMLWGSEGFPGRFETRIGYPDNYQYFHTDLDSVKKQGALSFYFDPDKILPSNYGKPMHIDWIYDGLVYGRIGENINRSILMTARMMLPGHIPANSINPSFDAPFIEQRNAHLYNSGMRTHSLMGPGPHLINFPRPMISTPNIINETTEVAATISQITRFGFRAVSDAEPTAAWDLKYGAICTK